MMVNNMKKDNVLEIGIKLLKILLAAFLLAVVIKLVVQPNKFLSGGVSGLTLLISRYVSISIEKENLESLMYSILYVVFNIPIFIFGFKKVGKHFIYYSIINVLLFTLFVSIIPSSWVSLFQLDKIDMLTSALLAGILSGVSAVISFQGEFSAGGTDIIAMYLSRSKGKGIGSYSFAMNVVILVVGGIIFKDYASLIYTVIYFFTNTLVINNLYIGHKKTLVEIVTDKSDDLIDVLMNDSHHGCTVIDALGAYSKKEKKVLRIVIAANQTKRICKIIKRIDDNSFTTLVNVSQVNGEFYIPPIK